MSSATTSSSTTSAVPNTSDQLLDVDQIGISFGGLKAVQKLLSKAASKWLVWFGGPNGAGKTTVLIF